MRYRIHHLMNALLILIGLLTTSSSHAEEKPAAFTPPPNLLTLRAQYGLSPEAEKRLLQNGFLVLDQVHYKTLEEAYPFQYHTAPMFVTTDAMLELWSSLNRELFESTEHKVFIKKLSGLLPLLEKSAKTLYDAAQEGKEGRERKALRQVLMTLVVARRLLSGTSCSGQYDPVFRAESDALVLKVNQHREANAYPGEDYTQYIVRGHYVSDPARSRYFRASMWLSRRFFAVNPQTGQSPSSALHASHLGAPYLGGSSLDNSDLNAAVACAAVVRAASTDARRVLLSVNRLRQTLTGPPNAIAISQLIVALDRVMGKHWRLNRALLPAALAALRRELTRPIYPRSQVQTKIVTEMGTPFPEQTVALLPGIAVPDSVLFRQTMHPNIQNRSLPTGLEVAAALGSRVARQEITRKEGEQGTKVLAAGKRFGARLREDSGASLYSGWLHALSTLRDVPPGAPAFMQRSAWQYEKLNTTLASWAQLRHNFILYADQNYAMTMGIEEETPALVEANPAFYGAMAHLAERTLNVMKEAGGLDAKSAKMLVAYEAKCREFEVYARAELAGTLTGKQSEEIDKFCKWLGGMPGTTRAALVADVATGMNTEVLHAATGDMNTLLVIPDPKTGVVYTGAVMSYYEFTRPHLDRLTDADWQAQQAQRYLRPERPIWYAMSSSFPGNEAGMEEVARAPLRAAEKLLNENHAETALALLRAAVAKNPDTTLATEAQYRIGCYYLDRHDTVRAENELQRCERLPGCEAFDLAQEQLRLIERKREHLANRQHMAALARQEALTSPNPQQNIKEKSKQESKKAFISKRALTSKKEFASKLASKKEGRQSDKSKALLTARYSDSLSALCLQIEAAFNRGDVEQTRRLLADYHVRSKGDGNLKHFPQDPVRVNEIEGRMSRYEPLFQQLKPLLAATRDPDMIRPDRVETNGEALAEALLKKLPDRVAEIYLTLSRVYQNSVLTMRFLERFPTDPQAGEAWKRLVGQEHLYTPGALTESGPEIVAWLAPFVNRNDSNSPAAITLLKRVIANNYGEAGIRLAEEEGRFLHDLYPIPWPPVWEIWRSRRCCSTIVGPKRCWPMPIRRKRSLLKMIRSPGKWKRCVSAPCRR